MKNSFLVPLPQVRPLVTKQVSLWANFQLKQEPTKQSRDSSRCGHADSVIDELSTLRFRVCFPEMKCHFAYLQYTLKDSPYKANVPNNCSTCQLLMTGFKPGFPMSSDRYANCVTPTAPSFQLCSTYKVSGQSYKTTKAR